MSVSSSTIRGDRTRQALFLNYFLSQRLEFDSALDAGGCDSLQALRDRAFHQLVERTLPTNRDENWRFTDISSLRDLEYVPDQQYSVTTEELASLQLPEAAHTIVFTNGKQSVTTGESLPTGVVVGNLATVLSMRKADWLDRYLAKQPGSDEEFTSLNTAGFNDVAIVWLTKNTILDQPIHVLFVSQVGDSPLLTQPRCLVIAERGSSMTLIEEHTAGGTGSYFTNPVTEIWVEENAQVHHVRLQQDGVNAIHIGKTAVSQARDARYTCDAIDQGAALSRHNLEIHQTGTQTETTLNGLTMIKGEQVADTHSAIAFTHPHGSSRQLQKCIVDDNAHAIFNGKVFVPQAAQLTDAGQLNRTLLLSPKARVDTKPQLEIVADNVKCTHGATVGQLDADELFYLQSRGIDPAIARNLLIYAFAYEILDQVPVESLRQRLLKQLAIS
ncbi:MAG: Fe-S cluster assembly protein SufD [Leptolyngbyaceae cyanobacterium SL_7_1]|nr:Fe-S cluster assembly protein SufD [Leptolyngbyaceae cyanobacterium SL_7_1]